MSADKPRKVIAVVKCTTIELKLTLTAKVLAKPLEAAAITPFLGAYNKKKPDEPPVTASALVCVTVDGVLVPDIQAIADGIIKGDSCKIELFPPGSAAPAAPAPPPAKAPVDVSDAAPAPAAPPPPAPKPAAAPKPTASGDTPKAMASNTMPKCKYGLACRIIDPKVEMTSHLPIEQQHWYKFQHPCFWICKEGHPEIGPPGQYCPLHTRFGMDGVGRSRPCPPIFADYMMKSTTDEPWTLGGKGRAPAVDPDLRRCFRHADDDAVVEEVVDETADELDGAVLLDEKSWSPPECGTVNEEDAMEAKMAAAEAASNGDFEGAVAGYSKSLAANPSALTYAKRAEALLKLGYPSAAIADCDKALEINPDSAKTYKVAAKALTTVGKFDDAYKRLCIGNKIDEDEDSAALQKTLKLKVDKMKKIGEQRAKRAEALFTSLDLADCWASLELDVFNRTGAHGVEALKQWMTEDVVSLKARLRELQATEQQTEDVLKAVADA